MVGNFCHHRNKHVIKQIKTIVQSDEKQVQSDEKRLNLLLIAKKYAIII